MTKCDKKQQKCDYSKTVIYKIECKDPNITKTYGGHSTNLIKRRSLHKSDCNNPNSKAYNCYIYRFIRENGGFDNWRIIWQYDYPCASKSEATLEETKFIKEKKCELNSVIPYVSEEEKKEKYKENLKEKIANETPKEREDRLKKEKEYNKKYNKEKIANETPKEREDRLKKTNEYNKKYNKEKIANETPKEREDRLKKEKEKRDEKTENETPEEREDRLKKAAEKIKCEICGTMHRRAKISVHRKSKKHLKNLAEYEKNLMKNTTVNII